MEDLQHEQIENMQQATQQWLEFRRSRIGASEASIVLGISPYQTPRNLWMVKTGKLPMEQINNYAVNRGIRFEAPARARYELRSDMDLPAAVVVHPQYDFIMASLDGYNKEAGVVLEIKCFTSKTNFQMVKDGRVPPNYIPQVQQQLLVTGAREVHFFCCLIDVVNGQEMIMDDALVIVTPDEEYQKELMISLIGFHNMMVDDIAPPLIAKDYLEAEDQSTVFLFSRIRDLKADINNKQQIIDQRKIEIDQLKEKLKEAREEAIELCEALGHPRITACGVNMVKQKDGNWKLLLAREDV
jgi:putative phage-type endonuclease